MMTPRWPALLFTRDADLRRQVESHLSRIASVRAVDELAEFAEAVAGGDALLGIVDLRNPALRDQLEALAALNPRCALIAIGEARSEPLRAAAVAGFYACEALPCDGPRLQDWARRAAQYVQACHENDQLRTDLERERSTPKLPAPAPTPLPWRQLSHVLRQFMRPDDLHDELIEQVAATAAVTRAGLFLATDSDPVFRLRGGHRCPPAVAARTFPADEPFARWLAQHDHLTARARLEHLTDPADRRLVQRMLDACGAEVLMPLRGRRGLIGWLFVGHRITGSPFTDPELASLYDLADHVATVLENAALYEEVAVQKNLAETLLHSMPGGLVAVGADGAVRWFNEAAERVLDLRASDVVGQPLKRLGNRLADALQRALDNQEPVSTSEWVDPRTRRFLSVHVQPLALGRSGPGAFALIDDLSAQRALEEKEEQLERAQFWTDLAAGMSHEIRNPLVAIKTFAQLLPERYADEDFRAEFSRLVTHEVGRLNGIIEQINAFAHPPPVTREPLAIPDLLEKAVCVARELHPFGGTRVDTESPPQLPLILGDLAALADALSHLIVNAVEATDGRPDGQVVIRAQSRPGGENDRTVLLTIRDNGRGIPPGLGDKVFSPFYTTKARGMGLGLPVARRAVFEHGGQVRIDASAEGTTISIRLPEAPTGRAHIKEKHEAHTGR